MQFLSQGDYNFPFTWPLYWAKHVYMWSFQTGTPNPDGFIRLPGRVLNFLVFMLFGNMAVSYFYAISSLIVAGISFYLFCRYFLKIKQESIRILSALFFALNPIFLGNLAKVGLILAAGLLPLCFLCLQKAFEKRQFRYFVLYLICLNISLMHPYTFTVNAMASGGYGLYMAWQHRTFVLRNLHKFALIGVLALLLNAYFILPVLSFGTVSKDVISDNVIPTQTDYTALVDFSNTGDIFTGLAFAKNVFLDFNFYNDLYQPLYLLGAFGLYALLLAAFLSTERTFDVREKRQMAVLLIAFLILILLATTVVFHIDSLIKFVISMPGGWAFRSPLKWQLYIPLALFSILALTLSTLDTGKRLRFIQLGLLASFILMNGYLFYDVYKMLLTPRTLTHFAQLESADLDGKTLLFVNSPTCMEFGQANPRIVTELNQIFVSRNVQVKRALIDDLPSINTGSYNYVLSCAENINSTLEHTYQFAEKGSYVNGIYKLYVNAARQPQVFAADKLFALSPNVDVGQAYNFVASVFKTPLTFVHTDQPDAPDADTVGLTDVFGNVSVGSLRSSGITTQAYPFRSGQQNLYAQESAGKLYYRMASDHQLQLSKSARTDFRLLSSQTPAHINLAPDQPLDITLETSGYSYRNLIRNPSLEQGLWQKKVDDCYAFDTDPRIGMQLDHSSKTDGSQSLALSAGHHIACTGPNAVAVKAGEHYLLHFDYQSTSSNNAGFHVIFDDPAGTNFTRRLPTSSASWQTFGQEIIAPAGAHHVYLQFYAYPGQGEKTVVTHYDNTSLVETPPLQNILYLVSPAPNTQTNPASVTYTQVNPAMRTVHVALASQPFYLATPDSYHPLWQLAFAHSPAASMWSLSKAQLPSTVHIRLNGTMNAWYIDPAKLCTPGRCIQSANGAYTFDLTMQFAAQHWFYVGAAVSSVAWIGCIGYFVYLGWKSRNKMVRYRIWH